jgi:hypothetical protein
LQIACRGGHILDDKLKAVFHLFFFWFMVRI